jgi:hypothetical protein
VSGYDESNDFLADVSDVEQLAGADNNAAGTVTGRFFHADGTAKEVPDVETELGFQAVFDQFDAEAEAEAQLVDPGVYEPLDPHLLTPEGAAVAVGAQLQAMADARQESYEGELIRRVGALAREYNISDPQRVEHVAAQLDDAMRAQFSAWLAQGYDPGQAAAALWNDSDLEGAIRAGLAEQKYLQVTDRTKMGERRRQHAAENDARAMMGLPPAARSFESSPSWQRMARRLAEQEQRREAQRELERRWAR